MTKIQKSLISIIMPVYNAGNFLRQTLESILSQTYQNWELICVDDGSTDDSLSILQQHALKDKRIKVFQNKKNQGVSATANLAITKIKGEYLARMDADDMMLPQRLEKQLSYLQKNSKIVAVGGQCLIIDKNGRAIGQKRFPYKHKKIYQMMYQAIPMQQPTFMISLKLLPKNFRWYTQSTDTAEEVDLLFRLFKFGKCANLADFVLKYRIHDNNLSLVNPKRTFLITYKTRKKAIKKYLYKPTVKAKIINVTQYIVVTLLPKKTIYPLFALLHGQLSIKIFLSNLSKTKSSSRSLFSLAKTLLTLFL